MFTIAFNREHHLNFRGNFHFIMDVAAFSGESFDPKDWINKALRASEPGQAKEEAAGSLVMKLQLMIAKLNSALEDQCNAVVQSVPRSVWVRCVVWRRI